MTLAVFADLATAVLGVAFVAGSLWHLRRKTVRHWRVLNAVAAFLTGVNLTDWLRNGGIWPAVPTAIWLAVCVSTVAGAHYAGKLAALRAAQTATDPKE